ncbi:hypothetical protein Pmani_026987 [Petrolisthes manimaculis]|uniref:Uncharacterized protein n=1 Tax=Petrolisthes manimaculis TaxID=1843537 RepID=A0AAE1P4X8_9EUCA|nr:hypothetical protein Pmani_026987 [Petrolisthes manimaculis]
MSLTTHNNNNIVVTQYHLLLLLVFVYKATCNLQKPSSLLPRNTQGPYALAQDALTTIISEPLRGQHLLLVTEDQRDEEHELEVGRVVKAAGASSTPILVTNQSGLLLLHHTNQPSHHTQGTLLTTILLLHRDPTEFLSLLADNFYWNPSYLVLLCLTSHLNTTSVLNHPVVQRSQYILLLHSVVQFGRSRLYVYGSSFSDSDSDYEGHLLKKTSLGTWNPDKFHTRQALFPSRFRDFRGHEIHLAAWCIDEPLMYTLSDGSCTGQNMDALNIIAHKFNFKVKLIHGTDDGKWGSLENGSWVGLLRELQHFDKHLVINSMILNLDTLHSFDYTYPYTISSYGFMIRVPPPVPQWRNILYPFSTLIWSLLLATTLTVAAIFTFLIRFLNGVSDPYGFALKVLGGLVAQSMNTREVKTWWWAKSGLVVWWLSVVIIAAAYTGNLVAVLTIPTFPKVFQTVQELATDDGIKTSQNPTMAALGDKLKMIPITNLFHLYEDIMDNEMNKGGYALIVFGDYIDFLRQKYNNMKVTYVMKERVRYSSLYI